MKRDLAREGVQRAYSVIQFKAAEAADGKKRTFTGVATTPSTDIAGDIVEPQGAQYTLPIPLLWQHDPMNPIGWITNVKVAKTGITIEGEVADVPLDGPLKTMLQDAWQAMVAGLVKGLSIGFVPLESVQIEGTWSYRYPSWRWLELSAVTIPCNTDASITAIKAADAPALRARTQHKSTDTDPLAATGQPRRPGVVRLADPPGASGKTTKQPASSGFFVARNPEGTTMKYSEQITAFEAKRTTAEARQAELMTKSATDGTTFDAAEAEEYDTLETEIAAINAHIGRLKKAQAADLSKAVVVVPGAGTNEQSALEVRSNARITVKDRLPTGTRFARLAMALAQSKGNMSEACEWATNRWKDTPEIASVIKTQRAMGNMNLKTAVAAGLTTDATWAGPLQYYANMSSEFIDLLRPMTILGKLTALRRMPFNVRVASQTSGSSASWVGEGAGKPVSSLGFAEVRLDHAKAAGIVVITQELARFSDPAGEELVSNDLRKTIATFLDAQFIDPSVLAIASVSPASITSGLTPVVSSGVAGSVTLANIDADVQAAFTKFLSNEIDPSTAVWVMKPGTALALSMKRTTQGAFAYPDIKMNGGTWYGLPVVTSNSVPGSVSGGSIIALVAQDDVFFADDGDIQLDVSQEASLQMVTNPQSGAQSLVSLWQNNLIGVRAERFVNWKRRRDTGVTYIDGVFY